MIVTARERIYEEDTYNRACLEVFAGGFKQALQLFESAIRENPSLKKLAGRDPDLADLRGNPRFQALARGEQTAICCYNSCMRLLAIFLLLAVLSACAPTPQPVAPSVTPSITPTVTATLAPSSTAAIPPTPTSTITLTRTPLPTRTATPTLLPVNFYDPAGCRKPPAEAGEIIEINGWLLNERTLAMLQTAQEMYGGSIELTGDAVTQGSYHDNGSLSFGTHMGGGAVDLSIFLPGTWQVDYANLPRLMRSLRAAGFAAWVRTIDEVYPGSGYHIHAIAVGDPQLSAAAKDQLTGPFGYFRGFDGLPRENGVPIPDRDGGPILCTWMRNQGYSDMRAQAVPISWPPAGWEETLKRAGQEYADTPVDVLAHSLYTEPVGLDRALAWGLWRAAGLLPAVPNPASTQRPFLQFPIAPKTFWQIFPPETYVHTRFDASAFPRDLTAGLLLPGDLIAVMTSGKVLLAVVTQVDGNGRAYAPIAQSGPDGWRVELALLLDPSDPSAGLLPVWSASAGFDRLRPAGIGIPPGASFDHKVQPGDTLPLLAARYRSSAEAIRRKNPQIDPMHLEPGQILSIPRVN